MENGGDFFKPKDTRQGRLYLALASERQSLFTLLPSVRKILLRAASSAALRTSRCPDDYSGSPFGCFRENADGTPATTESLWCEGSDDFFETRIAAERIPKGHQCQLLLPWCSRIAHSFSAFNLGISEASDSRRIARTIAERNGGYLHFLRSREQGLRASPG